MSEIKSIINKIGKNITKTSKDIISNTKLSIKLSSKEDKLNEVYMEIGKKVYEIYSYGGNLGEFFDKKYKEMVTLQNEINEIKSLIQENKQKEKEVSKIENIQSNKVNNNIIDSEEIVNKNSKICSTCNKENEESSIFCYNCGRQFQ